jgi:hypothetical protein
LTHGGGGVELWACDWSQAKSWTTSDNLQGKSDSPEVFLDRFNQLSVQIGLSIVQCCKNAGISRSLFYEIRDKNRAVSDKVWRKLERAERLAGISPAGQVAAAENAGSSGNPKDPPPQPGKKVSSEMDPLQTLQAQVAAIQARLDATFSPIQKIVSEFPMAELISRMQAANAWPPSPEDGKLSPALLMLKYAPPT